jgi:peptidoglycan/xylan/chitin deacetylase (PgdA/CDA1 family)
MPLSLARSGGRGRGWLGLPPVAPTILMYHRVADIAVDPWSLAVPPAWFERQMLALRRHRSPMSMDELVERLRQGSAPRDAVAVTFDDGYLDNLVNAKPVLENFGIPATLFLPTGSIGQPDEFWWDEVAKLTIGWPHAASGSLVIAGTVVDWSFPAAGDAAAGVSTHSDPRRRAHQALWSALRAARPETVRRAMAELRDIIGTVPRAPLDRAMTAAEIGQWLEGGLTGIAAHTITHRPLTALSPDEQREEIAGGLARCAELAGAPIRGFAYPYGDRNQTAAAAIRAAGIDWACSTRAAAVRPLDVDYYDLPRVQVVGGEIRNQWRTP